MHNLISQPLNRRCAALRALIPARPAAPARRSGRHLVLAGLLALQVAASASAQDFAQLPPAVASAVLTGDYRQVHDAIVALHPTDWRKGLPLATLTAQAGTPYIKRRELWATAAIVGAAQACLGYPRAGSFWGEACLPVLAQATKLVGDGTFMWRDNMAAIASQTVELAKTMMPYGQAHLETLLSRVDPWIVPDQSQAIALLVLRALASLGEPDIHLRHALVTRALRNAAEAASRGADWRLTTDLCLAALAFLAEPPARGWSVGTPEYVEALRLAHRLVSEPPIADRASAARAQVRSTLARIAASPRLQDLYPGMQQEVAALLEGG